MSARRAGSVRFDPYFKVQVWREDVGGAWADVQRTFETDELARSAVPVLAAMRRLPGLPAIAVVDWTRWRLMRVFPGGREPVVDSPVAEEGVA